MATEQDIHRAAKRGRDALQANDLQAAKDALRELGELAETFAQAKDKVGDAEQRQRVEELEGSACAERDELKRRASELEIDMLDPHYEQRLRERQRVEAEREAAGKAKAAQFLQGLGGPFAALAGLADLGSAKLSEVAGRDEVPCPACQSANPRRAKFCMECGQPMVRRCAACGADLGRAKFCPECGAKAS